MNSWFRRFLIVLTVGGGFMGLPLIAGSWSRAWSTGWFSVFTVFIFLALYGYGVYLGLRLADGREPIRQLVFYFAMQMPIIQSSFIVYRFSTGLQAAVGFVGFRPTWDFNFGDLAQLLVRSGAPLGIGVNLVAAIIVFVLCSPALYATDKAPVSEPPHL